MSRFIFRYRYTSPSTHIHSQTLTYLLAYRRIYIPAPPWRPDPLSDGRRKQRKLLTVMTTEVVEWQCDRTCHGTQAVRFEKQPADGDLQYFQVGDLV